MDVIDEKYLNNGLMNFFKLIDEEGNFKIPLLNSKEIKDMSEISVNSLYALLYGYGYNIFSVIKEDSKSMANIALSIVKDGGKDYLKFDAAKFLGLGNLEGMEKIEKLKSLEEFLNWIKLEVIDNPEAGIKLNLKSIHQLENGVKKYDIYFETLNKELEKSLNNKLELYKKNNDIVMEWVKNNTSYCEKNVKKYFDYDVSFNPINLFSKEEQSKLTGRVDVEILEMMKEGIRVNQKMILDMNKLGIAVINSNLEFQKNMFTSMEKAMKGFMKK